MRSASSKWLLGAGVVILAIIVASVAVALLSRPQAQTLLPADTPSGTVQGYLLAVEAGETRQAYGYLSTDLQTKCNYDFFRDNTRGVMGSVPNRNRDTRVALESERPRDDGIEVQVRMTDFTVSAPFNVNEYSHVETFLLKKLDGNWRFVDRPWPISWGCPEPPKGP
jgi:hypothetical protein